MIKNPYLPTNEQPAELSSLRLAYVGDAVFELLLRELFVNNESGPVRRLHNQAACYANAKAQACMYRALLAYAAPDEAAVLKRGRNAKPAHSAKSASVSEYRHATGVEALFGYLYLQGRTDRLYELFRLCLSGFQDK